MLQSEQMDAEESKDNEVRSAWDVGSVCLIYSRSDNKWYDGQIEKIINANEDQKQSAKLSSEWLIVRYKNAKKTKRIQRNCQDLKPIDTDHVLSLKKGSACLIYSKIIQLWCEGQVIAVFEDQDGEWLRIKYWDTNEHKICEIQRFSKELQTFKRHLLWRPQRTATIPDKPWYTLDSNNLILPSKLSNIIPLNDHEFIVAAYSFDDDELIDTEMDIETEEHNGIYKYNVPQNRWQLWIEYPKNGFFSQNHNLAIDYDAQTVFIANSMSIWVIDIKSKKFECFATPSGSECYGALTYVVQGEYNIFWGNNNNHHLLWDKETERFEVRQQFKELEKGMLSFGLVYHEQKEYFLLFGGYKGRGLGRCDDIWKYAPDSKEWETLPLKMPDKMQSFGSVLTLDGEYVLICGGSDSNGLSDNIWILDLSAMKWRLSKVKCPSKGVGYGNVIIASVNDIEYLHIVHGMYTHIQAPVSEILAK